METVKNLTDGDDIVIDNIDVPANAVETYNRLTEWSKEPSIDELEKDLAITTEPHDRWLEKIRHWNHLLNVKRIPENEYNQNRSKFQPKTIKKQAGWKYPALSEPFLDSKKMYTVTPRGPDDTLAAIQNERILNWQFDTFINKVKFIDDYVRSAVEDGTVVVKVGWKRETEQAVKNVPVFKYEIITDEQRIQTMMQRVQQVIELREKDPTAYTRLHPTVKETINKYEQENLLYDISIIGSKDKEYTKVLKNEPTLEIIDPENIYIDPGCDGNYKNARFMVNTYETTQDSLRKHGGYKNLDEVDWASSSGLADASTTTGSKIKSATEVYDSYGADADDASNPNSKDLNLDVADENRRKVTVHEYWGMFDINGDGNLKPIVASWIGKVMIKLEENFYADRSPPFILVPYLPVKRSLYGEADADLMEHIQDIYGATMRGIVDTLAASAVAQVGVPKGMLTGNNLQKFNNGDNYEYNPQEGNPEHAIIHHKFTEIQNGTINFLQFLSNDAESLTGTKSFNTGLASNAYGDVATGINGTLTATAQREMSTTRRLAEGIVDIGRKLSKMNQMFLSKEETVRVTNSKFIKVPREELIGNYDIKVEISTKQLDEKKAQDLAFILQTTAQAPITGIGKIVLAKLADLKGMPDVAEEIRAYEPSEEQKQNQMLDLQKKKADIQKVQSASAGDMAKVKSSMAEQGLKDIESIMKLIGIDHAEELAVQSEQSRGNQQLEILKSILAPTKEGESRGDLSTALDLSDLNVEKARTDVNYLRSLIQPLLISELQRLMQAKMQQKHAQDKEIGQERTKTLLALLGGGN